MTAAPKIKGRLLIDSGLAPTQVLNSYLCDGYQHVCQKDGHEFEREIRAADICERDPQKLFENPLEVILEKPNILFETKFQAANEKDAVSAGIGHGLAQLSLTGSFSSEIHLVADELVTNAVFNAPAIDIKTKLNPGVARSTQGAAMHSGKFGRVFLAQDQSSIVLGCVDPYGTLDIPAYLEKILATYEVGAGSSMNFGAGGAGIGSYIIFNTGCSLYVGVDPGNATIVSCVFPIKMSGRRRATLSKNLHLVQL